ncbi:MAG: class I SAM-dependent methyltransferase [Planctomycetota bacterium]
MTKHFYNNVYRSNHPLGYGGISDGMVERTSAMRESTGQWLAFTGLARRSDATILEIGCGMAHLADLHPGWHGAEYSRTAVEQVKAERGDRMRMFEADAQCLPFDDESYDGVFTWAALEHVPDPDKALEEVHRVLRRGGHALIAPAWNCRSWTVKKLEERGYDELPLRERLEKALIPVRELLPIRATAALPKRLLSELIMRSGRPLPLRYQSLHPRWDLIERLGHVSDDDAVADIDPHAAVTFFLSRGYEVFSHSTFLSRLLARHEPVIVRKPGA